MPLIITNIEELISQICYLIGGSVFVLYNCEKLTITLEIAFKCNIYKLCKNHFLYF